MPKAPIQAFKRNIEYYFTANQLDPLKSDLLAKEVLYFSNKIPIDELKEYLATNFDEFCIDGWQNLFLFPSIEATYSYPNVTDDPDTQGNVRGFSRYLELPYKFIATVDAKMPIADDEHYPTSIITGLSDHDIGINYNRDYINIKFNKDNGTNIFNNLFTIIIDPVKSEDLEAYLMQHYQSCFLLGITSLKLNHISQLDMSYIKDLSSYRSNQIMALESLEVKN